MKEGFFTRSLVPGGLFLNKKSEKPNIQYHTEPFHDFDNMNNKNSSFSKLFFTGVLLCAVLIQVSSIPRAEQHPQEFSEGFSVNEAPAGKLPADETSAEESPAKTSPAGEDSAGKLPAENSSEDENLLIPYSFVMEINDVYPIMKNYRAAYSYRSDSPDVAAVDEKGFLKGISAGRTVIHVQKTSVNTPRSDVSAETIPEEESSSGETPEISPGKTGTQAAAQDVWEKPSAEETVREKEGKPVISDTDSMGIDLSVEVRENKNPQVYLHDTSGDILTTVKAGAKGEYLLPSMEDSLRETFLGWSWRQNITVTQDNPWTAEYPAGTFVKDIPAPIHLYPVMFKKESEVSETLHAFDQDKYQGVIFVGDSRTLQLEQMLQADTAYDPAGISLLYASGRGLTWFLEEDGGFTQLKDILSNKTGRESGLPYAVILNLGVNDLEKLPEYINSLYSLQAYHMDHPDCKFFYMSVNPINNEQIKAAASEGIHYTEKSEAELAAFNSEIEKTCQELGFHYIDTYTWLLQNGFAFSNTKKPDVDDGLHYREKTLRRIFNYSMDFINQADFPEDTKLVFENRSPANYF